MTKSTTDKNVIIDESGFMTEFYNHFSIYK
jgi:hypothetical protein